MTIATVILAAGASSRMGVSKQLLPYRGRPLVAHAASMALEAGLGPVLVVVGAGAEHVRAALQGMRVEIVVNPDWERGMGSTIKAGMERLCGRDVDAAIIMLADQPRVGAGILTRLAAAHRAGGGADAVACSYDESTGVPALFDRRVFPMLAALPDAHGAKHILRSLGSAATSIACPEAAADIDTPADYDRIAGAAMPGARAATIQAWAGAGFESQRDAVVLEEPLEIRIRNRPLSITMRTPGHDEELAAGLLLSEGLVRSREDIVGIEPCARNEEGNVINVRLGPLVNIDFDALARHVITASSCGVCGKASIAAVRGRLAPVQCGLVVNPGLLCSLPDQMKAAQHAFADTGGLHAAAVFDGSGRLLVLREDVGRHNAVDKAVGRLFLDRQVPLSDHILLVSGRASFEIMQKAAAAGIGIVASVSAPSSLAVDMAKQMKQTLIGFLRPPRFNVYTHSERIMP